MATSQYGLPISDVDHTNWTEAVGDGDASHFDELDEGFGAGRGTGSGPDDATTYWQNSSGAAGTITSTVNGVYKPTSATSVSVKGRHAKSAASGKQLDITIALLDADGTSIASATTTAFNTTTWTTHSKTLTSGEFGTIPDADFQTGLRVATTTAWPGGGAGRVAYVSAHEIEFGAAFVPEQWAFRFYSDSGTESGAAAIEAENTNLTASMSGDYRTALRIGLKNDAGGGNGVATVDEYQLYVSKNGGAYTLVTTTSSGVRGANFTGLTEGFATTNRLSNPGNGDTFSAGEISEDGEVNDAQFATDAFTEHLFAIEVVDADVANGDTFDFKVYRNAAEISIYTRTPRITVSKSSGPQGTLNKTLGTLTASSAGTVETHGATNRTLGALTSTAVGSVETHGTVTRTLGAVQTSAAGAVDVVGSVTRTLGALTVSATGSGATETQGTLAATLGVLIAASAGTVETHGTLARTLGATTSTSAGAVDTHGTLTSTLGAATASSAGTVETHGTTSRTLGAVTTTGAGAVDVTGAVSKTLGALTADASGVVGNVPIEGTLAVALGALTGSAGGTVNVAGAGAATLGTLASTSTGAVAVVGVATRTLGGVTVSASGIVTDDTVDGQAAITLSPLTALAAGTVAVSGLASRTLSVLVLNATAVHGDPAIPDVIHFTGESMRLGSHMNASLRLALCANESLTHATITNEALV